MYKRQEYILNGLKCFITNGPLADYYMVVALTNPELKTKGLTAFIVEREWEGVSIGKIEDKCGIRCAQVSEVIFDNVRAVSYTHLQIMQDVRWNISGRDL